MIGHEGPIRWAANAPSAALLVEALREALPPTRMIELPHDPGAAGDDDVTPERRIWRIWPLDGPPLLLKRHAAAATYRTEVCNLRFFNAVARQHTPRLLACDDAASALLIEDCEGPTVEETEILGSLTAQHTWERVLAALAAIHARAERQLALLRRLYAPQWPAVMPVPPVDALEAGIDRLVAALHGPPLTVSERGALIAAGSWLHARLNVAAAHYRAPIVGLTGAHTIVATGSRVVFTEMGRPVLGLQPYDLLCTRRRADRRSLIERAYLAERARLGSPVAADLFWELDAALLVAASAEQLGRMAAAIARGEGAAPRAIQDMWALLGSAARQLSELQALSALIERRSLPL